MLAVMGATSTSSHAIQSPMPATTAVFSPIPLASASAYTTKSNTPMSPASPMSSHDSPKPSTGPSSASSASIAPAAKPQLAIKPVAPNAGVRPLQMAGGMTAGSPGGNVMSMTSVVSPMPQSPAGAPSPAASIMGKPPMSITSKEWVIPPRPKPGRKPATDTPPTKRKAQNRAAQRAFRERRAARVGELEDQLEDQKLEYDRTERDYQEKIQGLETDVQVLRSRCQFLESLLEKEKAANQAWSAKERQDSTSSMRSNNLHRSSIQNHQQQRQQSQGRILSPAPQKLLQHEHNARGSASSSISSASGRRISAQPFSISQIISPPDEDLSCGNCNVNGSCACADEVMAATSALDCGKCTLGTKCACLEESINALGGAANIFNSNSNIMDLKRPHSASSPPPMAPEEKKARHHSHNTHDIDMGTEIDFTHMFSRPKPAVSTRTPLPSVPARHQPAPIVQQPTTRYEIPLKERCGFCSDGTYCVCADSMPGVTMTGSLAISTGAVVAQQKTPPPSENDAPMPLEVTATGAIKLSSMAALRRQQQQQQQQNQIQKPDTSSDSASSAAPRSKCGPGGPGTCAQCLLDPVSGLFCRSLAANFERQGSGTPSGGGGCCGGGGAGGGCCKDKNKTKNMNNIDINSMGGSAADAASTAAIALSPASSAANAANTLSSIKPGSSSNNVSLPSLKQNLSLSCADAYKTLASHRHFDEATDEIGTWLPKLRAAPRHDSSKPAARHPMEVEAASIMSVLKGFDVRFGKCD